MLETLRVLLEAFSFTALFFNLNTVSTYIIYIHIMEKPLSDYPLDVILNILLIERQLCRQPMFLVYPNHHSITLNLP